MSTGHPLRAYARRVYSQNDDDGILEGIFIRLGIIRGWCVDVGAHDGVYLSNTANLIRNHGWGGLLIEGDSKKFPALQANSHGRAGVTCLNIFVSYAGTDSLDALLTRAGAPRDFDLLSIDVDGLDYHLWDSLRDYQPKVVIVEYNPSIPNHVRYVQPRDPTVSHGNSILSLVELGRAKGYQPAYVTETNLIVVRGDLLPAMGVPAATLDELRVDRPLTTTLFQGFDGTLLLDGPRELFWQRVPIDPEAIQIVPRVLRRYPRSLPPPMRALRAAWIAWYLVRRRAYWPLLAAKIRRGFTGESPPARKF